MQRDPISYDSLVVSEGHKLFGESWNVFQTWLKGLDRMDAPNGHKVWTLVSFLSLVTNNAAHTVHIPRLGHARLNLGIMFVGQIQTVIENLIGLVETLAKDAKIPLAPADTDGHRQGLISALGGYIPAKRKKASDPIGPKSAKAIDPAMLAKITDILNLKDSSEALKQFAETPTDKIDSVLPFDLPKRPTGMVILHLRNFFKDSYMDLSSLLVQCLINQRIDIQQQQHRYIIAQPALSILAGANLEDLIGRNSYVNRQFLANMIPVYNPAYYGTSQKMPAYGAMKDSTESLMEIANNALAQHEFRLTPGAELELNIIGEARIMTTDLNLMGLSDRRIHHLTRIAGIIAFARRATEIGTLDLRLAHTLLALNESTVEMCYAALMAERGDARIFMRLMEFIDVHGSVDAATLVAYLKQTSSLRDLEVVDTVNRFFTTGYVKQTESGQISLDSEGAQVRLAALTEQLYSNPPDDFQ